MREPELRPMIMWALTYRCNLRCKYCYIFTEENQASLTKEEASLEEVFIKVTGKSLQP